jgi:tetratricopeptide (TPR) repeat protein
LVEGNWTYQDEGILDRTHLRFFTYHEIVKLFGEAGYRISSINETLDPQYKDAKNQTTTLSIGRLSIQDLSPDELKRFFVYQYKNTAKLNNVAGDEEYFTDIKENCMKDVLAEGKSLEDDGAYEEAIKTYAEAGSDHADYAEALARIGNCYMQLQKISSAENYYQKSLKVEPQGYVASVGLGLLEVQLDKYDDAIKRFLYVTQNYPDSDKAFSGLGIAYSKKNKTSEAMDAFSRALKLNITNKPAMSNLLELSYQSNQFGQVELTLKQYLETHPDNTDILFGLAGIQYKSNRFEDAQNTLSRLLEFNPNHNDANIMLGKIDIKREKVC